MTTPNSELRHRRVAAPIVDGEIRAAGTAQSIPVSLGAGWRCVQATLVVLVVFNVVVALWAAIVATDNGKLLRALAPNISVAATTPGAPRFDSMLAVSEAGATP